MVKTYDIRHSMRVLDVGSEKGFLLHNFLFAGPGVEVAEIDISRYGIEHTTEDMKPFVQVADAAKLPFPDKHFNRINTLHNLPNYDLWSAFREIERVSRRAKYVCVEVYRDEREKVNFMYWQLTCRAFHTPQEWAFVMESAGYSGDHEFIFFE
jgi:protein-L-isoaspartate(D-aspartate) O-methyltransferase